MVITFKIFYFLKPFLNCTSSPFLKEFIYHIIPFSQIGSSVPQLYLSTQELAILTSIEFFIGLYQLLRKTESQSFNDWSLQLVDRSPDTRRVNRFFSSHGSELHVWKKSQCKKKWREKLFVYRKEH